MGDVLTCTRREQPIFLSIDTSFFLYWPRSYLSITPGSANLIKN